MFHPTLAALRDAAGSVTLLVETEVRQDAILLTGFLSAAERDAFRRLTAIQQVGRRVALDILSALPPERLAAAVPGGRQGGLARGAGGRTEAGGAAADGAEILGRDGRRRGQRAGSGAGGAGGGGGCAFGAGQSRAEGVAAQAAVSRAMAQLGEEATVEAVIRAALRELAPR